MVGCQTGISFSACSADPASGTSKSSAARVPATATPTGARTIEQAGPPGTRRLLGASNKPAANVGVLEQLPFTGLMLWLVALLGAALASVGIALLATQSCALRGKRFAASR
jgi:hypothetical protein